MGGDNSSANLIDLTPRQHYIAHWMLWKAYKSKEVTAAFFSMCNQNNKFQHRHFRITSRMYESLKKDFVSSIKKTSKELWGQEEFRKKHEQTNQTEYTKKLRSEKAKELWRNKEYRDLQTIKRKAAWATGKFATRKTGLLGDKNPSKRPEVRAKNSGVNHYSLRQGYMRPTCQYCGLTSTPTNIKRWHQENCKMFF